MTLIVETGEGLANANSYTSLDEAKAFHEANLYADDWNTADDATRSVALATATRMIDSACRFKGYRNNSTQALEWPRSYARAENFVGPLPGQLAANYLYYYPSNAVPNDLKAATALVALDMIKKDRTAESDSKGLKSIGIGQGAITVEFDKADRPVSLSDEAKRMLAKLVTGFRYGRGSVRIARR